MRRLVFAAVVVAATAVLAACGGETSGGTDVPVATSIALPTAIPVPTLAPKPIATPTPTPTPTPMESLLGSWQEINGSRVSSFYSDGTYDIVNRAFGTKFSGQYLLIDSSHVRIVSQSLLVTSTDTYEFVVSGNTLTLIDASRARAEYRRAS